MNLDLDFMLKEFVAESREMLAGLEIDLLTLEKGGENFDEKVMNKVFRAAHSIKGSSGIFDFRNMQELAHKTETVLGMIRSRQMSPNPDVVTILLSAFDKLREMINHPETSNDQDISENLASLTGLATAFLPDGEKGAFSRSVPVKLPEGPCISVPEIDLTLAKKQNQFIYFAEYDLLNDIDRAGKDLLDVMKVLVVFGKVLDAQVNYDLVGTLSDEPNPRIPFRVLFASEVPPAEIGKIMELPGDRIHLIEVPSESATEVAMPESSPHPETTGRETRSEAYRSPFSDESLQGESTIRVSVNILENLMNLASELVLSRNQLREALAQDDGKAIIAGSQRINLVTTELQEVIMQTRMQPIGNVFNKFPRLVRDLSRHLKKDIQLQIEGKEVEMDKTLIEGLNDPLTHMVRNACDHGIEPPMERTAKGKKASGKVSLKAFHEAGQVVIEIQDDGKGLDPRRLAEMALNKGLISPEKMNGMSDKEKMALIFLPGLSTAEKITDLSGRGVGMDVVKTNLDRLGGKIEINSEIGRGSIFRIKLPLTLAIIPSLIFSVGKERFAIPQINVVELLRIPVSQIEKRVELVSGAEVLNLRGKLLPLVVFREILGMDKTFSTKEKQIETADRRQRMTARKASAASLENPPVPPGPQHERRYHASGDLNVIIVSAGMIQYGLVVDQLFNNEEIVVKPLGRHLKGLQEYAGATIMGDGKVALIVDSSGLANKANLTRVSEPRKEADATEEALREGRQENQSFLVFFNGKKEECAVPLELVRRIERVNKAQIEFVGGSRTMQYRGASLPLVTLSDVAKVAPIPENRDLAVVVTSVEAREVGLLVAMPVDVLEEKISLDQETLKQPGVSGSFIVKNRTIMVLDVFEMVQNARGSPFSESETCRFEC